MINIFTENGANEMLHRINQLTPETKAKWGVMNVSQMLAHLNVPYLYVFEKEQFKKPNFFFSLLFKSFVKNMVTNSKAFKHSEKTGPDMEIKGERNFEKEKQVLISFIRKVQQLSDVEIENLEHHLFGKMSKEQWNTIFSKHLDHHLNQFGV